MDYGTPFLFRINIVLNDCVDYGTPFSFFLFLLVHVFDMVLSSMVLSIYSSDYKFQLYLD